MIPRRSNNTIQKQSNKGQRVQGVQRHPRRRPVVATDFVEDWLERVCPLLDLFEVGSRVETCVLDSRSNTAHSPTRVQRWSQRAPEEAPAALGGLRGPCWNVLDPFPGILEVTHFKKTCRRVACRASVEDLSRAAASDSQHACPTVFADSLGIHCLSNGKLQLVAPLLCASPAEFSGSRAGQLDRHESHNFVDRFALASDCMRVRYLIMQHVSRRGFLRQGCLCQGMRLPLPSPCSSRYRWPWVRSWKGARVSCVSIRSWGVAIVGQGRTLLADPVFREIRARKTRSRAMISSIGVGLGHRLPHQHRSRNHESSS